MKKVKKIISVVISAAMLIQTLGMAVVHAYNPEWSFDSVINGNDYQGVEYVYGQNLKSKDDMSARLYTTGGEYERSGDVYATKNLPDLSQQTGKYIHVSFDYFAEDLMSYGQVYFNTDQGYTKTSVGFHMSGSDPSIITFNVGYKAKFSVNTWSTIDVYFEKGTSYATTFYNGQKISENANCQRSVQSISDIKVVQNLFKDSNNKYYASGLLIDNINSETVDEIPGTLDVTHLGELVDFDNAVITDDCYKTNSFNATLVNQYSKTGRPSVRFWDYTKNTIEEGANGKPIWDKSLHSVITGGNQQMTYNTNATMAAGDIGHLTFEMSDNSLYYGAEMISGMNYDTNNKPTFGTVAQSNITFMNMSNNRGKIRFFEQDTDINWIEHKWYKFDIIFKNGNGVDTYTKVDCYIDGVKKISDFEWVPQDGSFAPLTYIGTLNATSGNGRDYNIDNIGFTVYKDGNVKFNPETNYTLSSTNTAITGIINNTLRTIAPIPSSYTVEQFKNEIQNAENVTVYNANGNEVTSGLLSNCTVKVSNGFGGGVYYSAADELVYQDIDFKNGDSSGEWVQVNQANSDGSSANEFRTGFGGSDSDYKAYFMKAISVDGGRVTDQNVPRLYLTDNTQSIKGEKIVFEASLCPAMQYEQGIVYYNIGTNASENLNNVVTFLNDGKILVMNRTLEKKWIPNQWYKIAVVTGSGQNTADVYINGELADQIVFQGVTDSTPLEYISRNRIALYNVEGQNATLGINNLKVTIGKDYNPELDRVTLTSDVYSVDNNNKYIGVQDCETTTAGDFKSFITGANVRVYADTSFASEVDDDSELAAGYIVAAPAISGKSINYYTIFDPNYPQIVKSLYPISETDKTINNVIIGRPIKTVLADDIITAPGNIVTVKDVNGNAVDTDTAVIESGMIFTISGEDGNTAISYTAKAAIDNAVINAVGEQTYNLDIDEPLAELIVADARIKIDDLSGNTAIASKNYSDVESEILAINEDADICVYGTPVVKYTVGSDIKLTALIDTVSKKADLYINGVKIGDTISNNTIDYIYSMSVINSGASHNADMTCNVYRLESIAAFADIISKINTKVDSAEYIVKDGAYGYIFVPASVSVEEFTSNLIKSDNAQITVVDEEGSLVYGNIKSGMRVKSVCGDTTSYYTIMTDGDKAAITNVQKGNGGVIAQAKLADDEAGIFILAIYNENGDIENVVTTNMNGNDVLIKLDQSDSSKTVKAMVWNNLATIIPICKAVTK